jgi:hypothetical protein
MSSLTQPPSSEQLWLRAILRIHPRIPRCNSYRLGFSDCLMHHGIRPPFDSTHDLPMPPPHIRSPSETITAMVRGLLITTSVDTFRYRVFKH